jgi:hypothetical protein
MTYTYRFDGSSWWMIIPIFISLIIGLFYIVCYWKLFTKAGKPGWAVLIPIYSTLVQLEILGREWIWLLLMFIPGVNLVIAVVMMLDLAKVFGKDTTFGCLMVLFPYILIPILALGDAKYLGPIAAQATTVTPPPPPAPAAKK